MVNANVNVNEAYLQGRFAQLSVIGASGPEKYVVVRQRTTAWVKPPVDADAQVTLKIFNATAQMRRVTIEINGYPTDELMLDPIGVMDVTSWSGLGDKHPFCFDKDPGGLVILTIRIIGLEDGEVDEFEVSRYVSVMNGSLHPYTYVLA